MNRLISTTGILIFAVTLLVLAVIGVLIGLWQLAVVSAAVATVLGLYWALSKARSASMAMRAIRTELRHIRSEGRNAANQAQVLATSNSEAIVASTSDLAGRIADIEEKIAEFRKNVEDSDRQFADIVRAQLLEHQNQIVGQRALIGEMFETVQDSRSLIGRTKQQLNRSVRRQGEIYGLLEILEGKLTARIDYFLDETHRDLRTHRGEISTLAERIDAAERAWKESRQELQGHRGEVSNLAEQIENLDRAWREAAAETAAPETFDIPGYLYYLSYHVPKEIEALSQLQSLYQPALPMPLLGGWAISPIGMLEIVSSIGDDRPQVVVECGSGTSTMWLAMALRDVGAGHVYALEHDPNFAEATRAQLADHDLTEYATVVDAPIVEHDASGDTVEWYDLAGLRDIDRIDMLIIDGPPQSLGRLRGGALTLLNSRLSENAHVFADDVNRPAERSLVRDWLEKFSPLSSEISSTPVQAHLVWRTAESR